MNTNGIILRDMNTDRKTTDVRPKTACLRGAGGTLARSILLLLLLLVGGARPCGTLSCAPLVLRRFAEVLQRMVGGAWAFIS